MFRRTSPPPTPTPPTAPGTTGAAPLPLRSESSVVVQQVVLLVPVIVVAQHLTPPLGSIGYPFCATEAVPAVGLIENRLARFFLDLLVVVVGVAAVDWSWTCDNIKKIILSQGFAFR